MSHDLTMHVGILAHQFKIKIIFKAEFSGCHDACIWCTHCKNNLEGRKIRCCLDFQFLSPITLFSSPITGDDNFAPPCPAKMVGRGWGNILSPHHGAGWGWVSYFYPQPTPPRPALIRIIIVNLVIRKWCHHIGRKRNLFLKNSSIFICYRTMFIFFYVYFVKELVNYPWWFCSCKDDVYFVIRNFELCCYVLDYLNTWFI